MREIKFRAWDSVGNCMIDWLTMCQAAFNAQDAQLMYSLFALPSDNKFLMQYTGLKDKNGVEIYEGDVVKTNYFTGVPGKFKRIIGVVRYHSPSFVVEGVKQYEWMRKGLHGDSEVIGNIYENPELLENQQ